MTNKKLERFEAAIEYLRRQAKGGAILVEGRKDVEALNVLEVGGEHRILNRGKPIAQVIDELAVEAGAEGWSRIVLLLDWDRTGRRLTSRLHDGLAGRATVDIGCRRRVGSAASSTAVEHLAAELAALRRQTV